MYGNVHEKLIGMDYSKDYYGGTEAGSILNYE